MADLFNNPSNDYIYPGLAPCQNVADDQYLVWDENGLSIIKGSNEIASIGFGDISIPVSSFNKQQITLGPGEVTYIQGLTKGLCKRTQGFKMPYLISTDSALNPYFFQIDLSINYYKNFSFMYSNIDTSANYDQNINISNALNVAFSNAGIKVSVTYEPSTLYFVGTVDGYDFSISNVLLSIIDASHNASSPFATGVNAQTYDLVEDASVEVAYARYPNTAMQGIALRGYYTSDFYDEDRWVYLNHVSDYVVTCDPISVNFDSDVSVNLSITFDPSTFIGLTPVIIPDISLGDASMANIIDVSIGDTTFSECTITNSHVTNSLINNLTDVSSCVITNSWTNTYKLIVNASLNIVEYVNGPIISNDVSLLKVDIYESTIWDSSLYNANIFDCSIYSSFIQSDVSLFGCTLYNCTYNPHFDITNNREILIDASIGCLFEVIEDTSTYYLKHRKKIEVGMSGCSVGDQISAGDYLNLVTVNNLWKKVGDMYIWTSSPDPIDCRIKNLIEGFYVFNPHESPVKIEYLVFV